MRGIILFLLFALLLVSSSARAQQLPGNPNSGTQTVSTYVFNTLIPYTNTADGTINIETSGTLSNGAPGGFGGPVVNGTLNNDGTLTNAGSLENNGNLGNCILNNNSGGTLTNAGAMGNSFGGTMTNTGTLTNNSGCTLLNDGTLTNNSGGTLTNDGTLDNTYGTLNNDGTLNNNDTLNNKYLLSNNSGGLLTNAGTLTNNNSAKLDNSGTLNNSGTIDTTGGTFTNNGIYSGGGTITGSWTDHGVATPGNSAGVLTTEGDYYKRGGSKEIELGGLSDGGGDKSLTEFDWLDVTGDVELAGVLDVYLIDSFELLAGMSFDILKVGGTFTGQYDGLPDGGRVGSFSGTNLYITYAAGDVTLFSRAVPEPAALLLALFGLALLPRRRRR